jgi:hypothetical protein
MTMQKVIYVSFVRLTDKVAADWHIDYLIERGVCVEYWDIVSLVREEHSEPRAIIPGYLRVLRSFDELEALLRLPGNRDAFHVMLISYAGRFTRIFRLLSKYNCRMVRFASGALPEDPGYGWRKIAAWLRTPGRFVGELYGRAKASALRKLKLVKPFAITFAAGDASMANHTDSVKVVPINFFDYDLFVKASADGERRLVTGRYAVFLDSNLPYHSDFALCGYQQVEPVGYYQSINRFFGLLERDCGVSVVIAAHPRADYDDATFQNRQIHRLVTAELVRDAEFVLTHASTAMSFAVLNAKPLVFIYTEGMAAAYQHSYLRAMRCYADYLDAPIYNVDEMSDAHELAMRQINLRRYERYKYSFLTSRQSESTSTREILWRELHALTRSSSLA